jgi:hypothetical protein
MVANSGAVYMSAMPEKRSEIPDSLAWAAVASLFLVAAGLACFVVFGFFARPAPTALGFVSLIVGLGGFSRVIRKAMKLERAGA